jgi:hypothetical protein
MLDPKEVADHLEMVLLSKITAENDWLDYDEEKAEPEVK